MTTLTDDSIFLLDAQHQAAKVPFTLAKGGGRRYTAPLPAYPRLPEAPALTGCAEHDGLEALRFVIREDTTAPLSDEAIALALHVAPVALCSRGLADEPGLSAAGLASINRTIDLLSSTARRRAVEAAAAAEETALRFQQLFGDCDDKPNQGPMAPLDPLPVGPAAPDALAAHTPVVPAPNTIDEIAASLGLTPEQARQVLRARAGGSWQVTKGGVR